jgi:serine/threonine protein kinase
MAEAFDPYYTWLGIPPDQRPLHQYRLLGLRPFEENPEVIENAANQRMAHLRTFQIGRHGAQSQQLLNEVAAARVCLLNRDKKAAYDAQLRARLPAESAPGGKPSAPEAADRINGSLFGEYLLLDQLGSSRTGPVFKARHRTMGRVVAIKILSQEAAMSPEALERFHRKVKILAQLSHPNLVAAYDAGERDGIYYLVMEHVDGQNLIALLKQCGPPPVRFAVNYVVQAAAGLGYAHSHGVYHRNVKPSNLMVSREGVVKVIGLGLARIGQCASMSDAGPGTELTHPGQVVGTLDFMAPEQAADSRNVDARSDVYSLGCVLHTLLLGRPPYAAKSPVQQAVVHRSAPIPSLRAAREDVPDGLDAAFQKMLAKRPEDRYQTMQELAAALKPYQSES